MKLDGSEPAVNSLQALHEFITLDSRAFADAFVQRLIVAAESLEGFPLRGRVVPELRRNDVREILFQNYRIIHRVQGDHVVILAIVHGARDLDRLPRPPWEYG